jgi:hypothetical protein
MWFVYLALTVLVLYAGLVAAVALGQTALLFPARLAGGRPGILPDSAARLEVRTPDGETLAGARLPAQHPEGGAGPILLGFGGNAWNAEIMARYLHDLFPVSEVVAFHYRGYPPSTGRPSSKALLADALGIYDELQRDGSRPVLPVGFSIGSGVAAYLASQRNVPGMILVTPFDSLAALARDHFRWAPVHLLFRHEMAVAAFVRNQSTPTAVIAAGRDEIVPGQRTDNLRKAIPNRVFDRIIAEAGHNDLYDHPAFRTAMHEAYAAVMVR